ncbi:murein transglycosylase A [Sandaracinobacteroides saxicola]|uniref:peptidoglycan lytic exotransglycosylase n=1 Tax=Sandaracinobacteroides saxicola TaxID=2759707 RepID=A0A7G5IM11_9SPHN|nr:murein transglycosylase A [Sandaracinobacteroides saxicola]QMW24403.1 murein transglycosylase A [Sandaracinobacteroides saxicola]
MRAGAVALLAATLTLAGCATRPQQPINPAATPPISTAAPPAAFSRAGAVADLPGWRQADLAAALAAFKRGCAPLGKRKDPSGLTVPEDWAAPCAAAAIATDARGFFESQFTVTRLGDGKGFTTGYFEPEIAGCRAPTARCSTPLYRKPDDLLEVDLTPFASDLKGRKIRGRWDGKSFGPYPDRAAIYDGALKGRGLELAYAEDPIELFMLEVQGSGRLRLPDGSVMRVGYASQNGRPYVAIGRLLRQRNILPAGGAGLEAIIAWVHANPGPGDALMRENPSYVFFREMTGPDEGPHGALGVSLIAEATAAADATVMPLGAPVWLRTRIAEPGAAVTDWSRLLIAQDIGGAIRGPNRFDIFWGAGPRARAIASNLATSVEALILLPHAAAARLPDGAQARR